MPCLWQSHFRSARPAAPARYSLGNSLPALPHQVDALAELARNTVGPVSIWINNAGAVTSKRLLADVPADEIAAAVGANVLGSLFGSRAAIRLMRSQPAAPGPAYHVFNLGFSSWGASFSKTAATHKSTKRSLTQLTASLVEELRAAGGCITELRESCRCRPAQKRQQPLVVETGPQGSIHTALRCGAPFPAGLTSSAMHTSPAPGLGTHRPTATRMPYEHRRAKLVPGLGTHRPAAHCRPSEHRRPQPVPRLGTHRPAAQGRVACRAPLLQHARGRARGCGGCAGAQDPVRARQRNQRRVSSCRAAVAMGSCMTYPTPGRDDMAAVCGLRARAGMPAPMNACT
eukprot:365990-Chlamydomonas_euryale.AAC.37